MSERPPEFPVDDPMGKRRSREAAAQDHTTEVDAAQSALNRMRRIAKSRGELRIPRSQLGRQSREKRAQGGGAERYGNGRDPQGLGNVVSKLVSDRGWTSPLAVGSVMTRWDSLVGPDIAAHCRPESFNDTTLHVRCDSTSWATQLRLMTSSLLARFDEELGRGVVTNILVLGPAAPSWRKGYRNIKGRGPRDTYG